jgi:hypothetical protein
MLGHMGKPPLPTSIIASYIGAAAMLARCALGDPGNLDSATPAITSLPDTTSTSKALIFRTLRIPRTTCYCV